MFKTIITILTFLLSSQAARAQTQAQAAVNICGTLWSVGQYGPYDYRVDFDKLPIVLGAHFTPEVEMLIKGKTSTTPGNDIDYTLRAIPNNPRALIAMMKLAEKEKTNKPNGARYDIDCYFERALRFRSNDYVVRMIFASYLTKQGKKGDALAQLAVVEESAGDNPFTRNNLGLLYFDLTEYDKAKRQAHLSHSLGMQQSPLQEKLKSVGKWDLAPDASSVEDIATKK